MSNFTLLEVAGVMSKSVQTIEQNASIYDVAVRMKENDIGSLLVMDKKECLGLITERDLVFNFIAEGKKDPKKEKLENYINRKVDTIAPGESIFEARELMVDNHIEYLLVTEDDTIIGIVSQHDLLK